MSAYVVANIEVTDHARYDEYRALAAPSIAAYDGRYLVRGTDFQELEGEWPFSRLVIIEFPTRERALEWFNSPEYAKATEKRIGAADMRTVLMDEYLPA